MFKSIVKKILYQINKEKTTKVEKEITYDDKRRKIEFYRQKYGYKLFVESGTFLGDTIEYFKCNFSFLYSIELSKELAFRAQKRFAQIGNIKIIHGDSAEVLKNLINDLKEPALFWLDGHYSSEFYLNGEYFVTAKSDVNTPIEKELDIILGSEIRHIILIDDARLFTGENGYPKVDEIQGKIQISRKKYKILVDTDIIQLIHN